MNRPGCLEALDLGNEDGATPKDTTPGKPTTRRYSPEEKAAAVRMGRTLRAELGTEHGTIQRVAAHLAYGTESVRLWVRQADIDEGHVPGVSTSGAARMKPLEQGKPDWFSDHRWARAALIRAATPSAGPEPHQVTGSGSAAIIEACPVMCRPP